MTNHRPPTTISTTKPLDTDVRCDTCGSSIEDGSTLSWNPLAAAIECHACAAVEVQSRRIVVATVARSRGAAEERSTDVTNGDDAISLEDADAMHDDLSLDDDVAIHDDAAFDDENTPRVERGPAAPAASPAVHPFDASSAIADVAAWREGEVFNDDDDITAEVVIDRGIVRAHDADEGRDRHDSGPVVAETAPGANLGAFAPPVGLQPVPIPAPAPAGRIADHSPELEAVLEAVAETRTHEPLVAPTVSPRDVIASPAVSAVSLNDRRIPRSRATIGCIVVASSGVFVTESCSEVGQVSVATKRRGDNVRVGGVDQSKTLKRIRLAHQAVSGLLHVVGADKVAVRSALVVADGATAGTTSDGIEILSVSELDAETVKPGGLDAATIASLAEQLAQRFPLA